ncbi:hypothetical protein ACLMJK_005219 [Lecanora helva]
MQQRQSVFPTGHNYIRLRDQTKNVLGSKSIANGLHKPHSTDARQISPVDLGHPISLSTSFKPAIDSPHASNGVITWNSAACTEQKLQEVISDTRPFQNGPPDLPDALQQKVALLPPEISKMIMDALYKDIFGPKKLYPQKDRLSAKFFLALDRQMYKRWSNVYWSRNTWVIGQGSANDSMRFMTFPPYDSRVTEFSKQRPNDAAMSIRRVEICFCTEDLQCLQPAEKCEIVAIESLDDIGSITKSLTADLIQIWQDKFDRIAFLDLDYLMLDFSKANAPDGAFLGATAVQRFLPFMFRMPAGFRIVAPTKALEDEIRRVFQKINEKVPLTRG